MGLLSSRYPFFPSSFVARMTPKAVPYATVAKCHEPCLNTAGLGGVYSSIQKARIRKTLMFLDDKGTFMAELFKDIFF